MARAEFFADRRQEPSPTGEEPSAAPAREDRSCFRGDRLVMAKIASPRASLDEPDAPPLDPRQELCRLVDQPRDEDVPMAPEVARPLEGIAALGTRSR